MSGRATLDARPLYAQVRDVLLGRLCTGALKPGSALPNEFDLARELGVSQGTVRKALDALTAEQLLVRRQGRGTFVREQTAADVMFRFFHLYDETDRQIRPDSRDVSVSVGKASAGEQQHLRLTPSQKVIRIGRIRTRDGKPFILETIALPARLFKGLAELDPIPNTLYDVFQRTYGVTIARTDERLTAVAAGVADAGRIGIEAGAPLLRIDRTAFALDDRPVEWRVSLCHLDGAHYLARVR